jgi:DNA-binding transcriptional LysR family regulator
VTLALDLLTVGKGEYLLPVLLGDFKALHPAIGARVVVSDSLTTITEVRNGAYEVGFCGISLDGQDLESFKIAEDETVLIVFPEHLFAQRQEVSFAELEGEPLIFNECESGTRQKLESLIAEGGSTWDVLHKGLR